MAKAHWDAPGVHAEALNLVAKELDTLLAELSKLWRHPEISSEEAQTRAANVRTKLGPILESERNWLQKSRDKLDKVLDETGKVARELGETPPVKQENCPLSQQRSALKTQLERFTKLRERQSGEIQELRAKVVKECKRLNVQASEYAVEESLGGGAAVKALNAQMARLDAVMKDRVDAVLAARGRIRKLADKLGEALEFRLAFDGELPGSEGGVVVLSKTAENEKFVRDLAEFKEASTKDVSLFSRCSAHLKLLEAAYQEELERKKPNRSASASRSRSRKTPG
ncbi:unnamed protein product [Effrenium voratum]|nr:unnamed protein product [Effrenium voratum]